MSPQPVRWVIGVDGGGTKTLAILADASGIERVRRLAGPSNPNLIGVESAARCLGEILADCCSAADCTHRDLSGVVLGLAGAGNEENRAALAARLKEWFGAGFPLLIETDARIALEGGLGGRPGIAVIAGTGSIVAAKTPAGEIFTVGGWGRALGDEGSGFSIGFEAARALAMHLDCMLEKSLLPQALRERFGWDSREALIHALYREKVELSACAPLVVELAQTGDDVCIQILRRSASALAGQISAAFQRIGMDRVDVATCGGLIERPSAYRDILDSELRLRCPGASVRLPERTAAEGAVLLALKMAGEGVW